MPGSVAPHGRLRWSICALLFFATTVNYIDRAVLGVLKPALDAAFGWNQKDYGWVVTAFQAA
ncbi:MAG: MFS transporter, partial [Verrucomicrobia bacterium]|nr:MFS transporter [Verrucomicrobiota bacterium]